MPGDADLGSYMAAVAERLLGEPNHRLSSDTEWRYGTHGSLSIDLRKGTFFDHEAGAGGGVLELIGRETGLKPNGPAMQWLRDEGIVLDTVERAPEARSRIVATYDYVDESGELVFQVVRLEPKTFRQRRRSVEAPDGWVWNVKGVRQVPYRLPEMLEAIATDKTVYVVEGEKDADNLWKLGVPATTNAMGAGKWPDSLNDTFVGADVVLIPDKDEAGRKHVARVGAAIKGVAARVRVLELPVKDASDWIAAGGTLVELQRLVETDAGDFGQPRFESRFGAVWFDDIPKVTQRTDWLVKGLIGAGDFSAIYGEPKGGKSFLALDLSLTIATAALTTNPKWFDRRVFPGGVIYVATEGQRGMLRRVNAWRQHHSIDFGQGVPFVLMTTRVDLCSADGDTKPLIEEINYHARRMSAPPRLVIIDTLARAMAGGNENGPEDMGAFIGHCGEIQQATTCHVEAIHHTGKETERGMRGHNSLRAAIDTAIEVGKSDLGGNLWTLRDQKEGEAGLSHAFRLQQVTTGVDEDGDAITSCVVAPSETTGEHLAGTKKQSVLPDQARIALRQLHEAILDAGEQPTSSAHIPQHIKAVPWKVWRDYCYRGGITSNDAGDDTKQKAFKRAGEVLRARGYIGSWDAWVWTSGRT